MQGTHQKQTSQKELAGFYKEVREHTEKLCDPLETEDYIPQPVDFVSPPKWNIAHTTWFFEEMILKPNSPGYIEFDPTYGFLFNSYYESLGTRVPRHKRGELSRPTVGEVLEYRRFVDEKMLEFLGREHGENVHQLIMLGLNHEQQHQELFLTDLKYTLSLNSFDPVYHPDFALCEKELIESNEFIEIEGGIREIGFSGEGFHFDNELGRHKVFLDDFHIQKNLVTNGEYLEFIEAGGYTDFRLWHSEGWDWVRENEARAPLYWKKTGDVWQQFTLAGRRNVNPLNPVCHISFYEAAAFAEWRGKRLPTEVEWETAADQFDWGSRWEWTNSAYLPYPRFKTAGGAVGEYNGKFMVNQMVLRGASVATPAGHSRKTYRNFFHPPLNWQFTGIRLAQ